MAKVFQYSGWLVAVLLLLCCGFLANEYLRAQKELALHAAAEKAQEEMATVDRPANKAVDELAELEAALEKARARISELEVLASATDEKKLAEDAAPEEEMASSDEKKDEDPASDGPSRQERIAQAQLGIVVDMVYADLFTELGLAADQAAPLRDAIAASMLKQQQIVQGAMKSKDRTAKAVRADRDGLRAELRSEMAGMLTADELAAYDAYEAVADQIMMEKTVDSQLGALASGLSAENRLLTSQVMAEELVREFDLMDQSEELYTLDNFNAAQTRALNTSLDRLGGTIAEDQWAMVDGFVNHALRMFEAMADGEQ